MLNLYQLSSSLIFGIFLILRIFFGVSRGFVSNFSVSVGVIESFGLLVILSAILFHGKSPGKSLL